MMTDDSPAVRKTLAELRPLCAQLPGSQEYVMVHHPAFRVAKKPFAIVGMVAGMEEHRLGSALSINLGRDAQPMLLSDPRFTRTPYIGQHGWVTVAAKDLRAGEMAQLVEDSWRRVANQKQLSQRKQPAETPPPSAAKARSASKTPAKNKAKTAPGKAKPKQRKAG
jgi:predicted DNA-binding protein (MmcQ/YjbR family)